MEFLPHQTNIYQNDISQNARKSRTKFSDRSFRNSMNGIETGMIPRNFNENIINKTNKFKIHEQLQDIKEQNDNDKKYMISPLSGERIPVDNFSHNNMVPFFGSKITQNMSDEQNQQRLESFTGNYKNYKQKTEVPTMFQPKQEMSQVYGTQVHNNDLFQRYIASSKKTNELPIKQVKVGSWIKSRFFRYTLWWS